MIAVDLVTADGRQVTASADGIDDPPGLHNYWSGDYHDTFPDEALDVFVKYGSERQSPFAQQILVPWGGASLAFPTTPRR